MNAAMTARTAAYLLAVLVATAPAAARNGSLRATPAGSRELLQRAEVALASGDRRAAHEAWEEAYRTARHARATDDLLAVGDAYLRIGEAVRDRSTAVASARHIFSTALFQARERREAAAVAAAAAAFAALGDGEMADRGFAIATAIAIERGDTAARERIAALQAGMADAREGSGSVPRWATKRP
jgi:hypothetical protein